MASDFTKRNHLFFDYLDYFSSKLETTVLENVIKIPPQIGTGSIKWYLLEEGFGLRFYDFILNKDIDFNLFIKEEAGDVYKLIFAHAKKSSQLADMPDNKNAYLYCSDFQKNIKIKRGDHICSVVLIFNTKWLEKNYPNANEKIEQLQNVLIRNNQPTAIPEELDRKGGFVLMRLVEMFDHSSIPPLILKTNLFLLLSNFLDKIILQSTEGLSASESLHYCSPYFKEIVDVAENLEKYINNPFSELPNIGNLAQEFHMSESTLRRHFKIVYGKNIYEYYQGKRMCWAKGKLEKEDCTISELALKLGFRKPNNFSKAFQKEFHMLPSQLKHLLTLIVYLSYAINPVFIIFYLSI